MAVKIYYGMSGTLKYTKLSTETSPGNHCILSTVKPHLSLSRELLGRVPLDTDFALERLIQYTQIPNDASQVRVERGITDFLESWTSEHRELREDPEFIGVWINKEDSLLQGYGPVTRELLVMSDCEFIEEKILSEPSRSRRFPDLSSYLARQSEYIEFTKTWNRIDYVTEILDAKKFIEELKN